MTDIAWPECLKILTDHAREADEKAVWPAASWQALGRAGVLGWSIDLAHGGSSTPVHLPFRHQGAMSSVGLSADGKIAITASQDRTARLWETLTGKPIGPILQHESLVTAVALSADGTTAVTGSWDTTARLWETISGKAIGPPLQHQREVMAVALSADGKTALTGSKDNTARLWKVPQPMRGDPERIMLWTQVITGLEVDDPAAVRVLDAVTWQQRRQRLQERGGPLEQ